MDDSQECRSQRARCTVPHRCGCHLAVIGCRQKGQLSGHFARLQRSHTCRAPVQAQQAAWEVNACMTQSDSDFRCTLHHVSTVRLCNILAPNIIDACKDFKNAISMTQLPQSMVAFSSSTEVCHSCQSAMRLQNMRQASPQAASLGCEAQEGQDRLCGGI